jgi:hypothetical protein
MKKYLSYIIKLIIVIVVITFIIIYSNHDYKLWFDEYWYFKESEKKYGYLLNNNVLNIPLQKQNKIAVVTFDTRKDDYIEKHNINVRKYCDKWKYDYFYYDTCAQNVYWCKLYLVLNLLKTNIYDYVVWLDSDTIIKKYDISFNSIVNSYSSDIFVTIDGMSSVYNAGVFIIKKSDIGMSYLEDCISHNKSECYNADGGLKGQWSGLCYEQGIMNKLIFDKYNKNTTCLSLELVRNILADPELKICDLDVFILHLYASSSNARNQCFSKYV